jgi:hypothetical protein
MSWVGHVAGMSFGKIRREFWWGKPERMNGRCKCEDNVKLCRKEIVWESLEWIYLTQNRGPVVMFWEDDNVQIL